MSTITWLHISDLHWRESQAYDANVVAQALLRDLANRAGIAPELEHIDFIFVTGDIASTSQPEEYRVARQFFTDLLQTTGVRKSRLFIVPGNHDVDRDAILDDARDTVNMLSSRQSVNRLLDDEVGQAIAMQRFHHYQQFVNTYLRKHLPFDSARYFYVKRRKIGDKQIAILGFNSAWASASDADRHHLFLGERQVRDALKQAKRADIRIALMHHPFEWLRDFDREDCEALLLDKCHFILHGHLHRTGAMRFESPESEAMVIGAGACYETREYPNAYNLVHLDFSSGKGTVYLRMYSDREGGFWTKDLLTHQDAPGEYTFDLPPNDLGPLRLSVPSLEDWEGNDCLALDYDATLGKRVLMKKGPGFDPVVSSPPLDWQSLHYHELTVRLHPESFIYINVLDSTGKNRTLLYSAAILPGLNQWGEFHVPLDRDVSDGDWHSLIIDLAEHMEQAHWPGFVKVNWLSLRGEVELAEIRGCDDKDSLMESAVASPYVVHFPVLQVSKLPQILLDFASAPSLQDWENNDHLALEYDTTLGKRVLMKKRPGFDRVISSPPLDWRFSHYELVVRLHSESFIYINVLDKTGENRTLLYSSAILSGPNQWGEFRVPLDRDVSDGDWHSLIIDLAEHMEQAHWPGPVKVNWLRLRGEVELVGIRGCDDKDSLVESAVASPYVVHVPARFAFTFKYIDQLVWLQVLRDIIHTPEETPDFIAEGHWEDVQGRIHHVNHLEDFLQSLAAGEAQRGYIDLYNYPATSEAVRVDISADQLVVTISDRTKAEHQRQLADRILQRVGSLSGVSRQMVEEDIKEAGRGGFYRTIGGEILSKLEIDRTRLGEALSTLSEMTRGSLEGHAWDEVRTYCGSARELCDNIQRLEELSDVIGTAHAEGIFHAYEGISHLYQADEIAEEPKESEELDKAIDCLEKSRERFHGEYRDQWNEAVLWLNLGRIHRSQNRFNEALAAFQRSCTFSNFNMLSIEKRQEVEKVALEEIEKTRAFFGFLLKFLDTDQRRSLENVRAAAERIWSRPPYRYYTDQAVSHSERVIALLDGLTTGIMTTENRLSSTEVFILLAAAYLHDIGMQDLRVDGRSVDELGPGDWEAIRNTHHEATAELIHRAAKDPTQTVNLGLPDDSALVEMVALVAKGHHQVNLNSAEYDPVAHGDEVVRPRLLAALLRLSSKLDIDHRRVDPEQMKLIALPPESQLHWWKCHYVSDVSIEDEYIQVRYRFPQDRPDYEGLIVPLVEKEIRTQLSALEGIFRANAVQVALGRPQMHLMRLVQPLPLEVEALARQKAIRERPAIQYFPTVSHSARTGALMGDIVRLSLRLTPEYPGPGSVPIEARQGEVSFFIQAEGFCIQEGEDVITLSLPVEGTEEVETTVELQARLPGVRQITIEPFYDGQRHEPLSVPVSVRFDKKVKERPELPSPLAPRPVPQPDLCLRVYTFPLNQEASRLRLEYVLYSPLYQLRLPSVPVGSVEVSMAQLARLRSRLNHLLRRASPIAPEELYEGLKSVGRELYTTLFSSRLKEIYCEVWDKVASWLVFCDADPWIPWELVKPHGRKWEHDFLAARYSLGRWVEGWGVSRQGEFPIGTVYFAPDAGLAGHHAMEEWTELVASGDVPRLESSLLVDWPGGYPSALSFSSSVWGLHFESYPERLSPALRGLVAQDTERFSSEEVAERRLDLRQKRPVVTFGMLALERQTALTEVEARWMPTFIQSGASAFIGPLWATAPHADRIFWRAFYQALWERVPLGEAMLTARRSLRQVLPDSLDWLAYFMVGDPMARGYIPHPGEGYVALECRNHDLTQPMQMDETYSFVASLRTTPPPWYTGRLYQTQAEAWDDPQVFVFAPGFAAPQALLPVDMRLGDMGSVQFDLVPKIAGEHDIFVKFLAGEQVRQSLTLHVDVESRGEGQR